MGAAAWPAPSEVAHIQVIRRSALGDVVLCEPAIAALARRYPEARLEVVTNAPLHPLFAGHPGVHACLELSKARRLAAPDLAVDLHHRIDTWRWAGAARHHRVWVKRGPLDLWRAARGLPLHRGYHEGPHQLARIAAALPGLHLPDAPRLFLPPVLAPDALAAAAVAQGAIVLVPGASRAVKAWPAAHFARLGRDLAEQGHAVVVLGGAAEAAVVRDVAAASGASALDPHLDVAGLMAVLGAARLVVGNDSGPAHVAQALGTPTVVLFGPTPPGRWGPRAPNQAVSLSPSCGPCSDHGARPCRQARRWCLDDLGPERALAAVVQRLSTQAEAVNRRRVPSTGTLT